MTALSSEPTAAPWTAEQLVAIERREGELLLDAGAGSGKSSVLVERFVRAVLDDGVDVAAILAITFTDKAAAELRERIRKRLRELGADEAARATESAFISTIHGFCARVLRANALAAGIDPGFTVLDQPQAGRLADSAFDAALEQLARDEPGGIELIAAYTPGGLRGAILGTHGELRSRGETEPRLLPLAPGPDLMVSGAELVSAASLAARELGGVPEPSAKVIQALERLERVAEVVSAASPWPGEVGRLGLPGGNGAALSTERCLAYSEALARFKTASEHVRVQSAHGLLDRMLQSFGAFYRQRKRAVSGLDFEDLELLTRDLLAANEELRERYRSRFTHVMVDELQDTNGVQLELIGQVASDNVFMVGDAQQSIYAFRHADVELFERLGERLDAVGARARLQTNFRSRAEILEVVGRVFAPYGFERLRAGRSEPAAPEPLVELLIADKGGDWAAEGIAAPWRIAEARALARRVGELVAAGAPPREFVVLTRATTDLRAYERALEERGIPTYVIGGRGYWAHPQIVDVVSYLRALANPRDEEALYTVLASPLVGVSVDALVVLAAAGRSLSRDPWWVLREPEGALDELGSDDAERSRAFVTWFAAERAAAARLSVEELIDRVLTRTGYDLAMLAMPGGRRRLANVRKLMRLGREQEALAGRDLRAFLELVRGREAGWAGFGDARESEAPVEGEALDAVRLMTIHRAKGLEFPIVCVADLGRQPWRRNELLRIGGDGRFGMRLAEPGTGRREPALDYEALGDEQFAAEEREERRLFYVAMTRARERLLVSGAAKLEAWDSERSPMGWIGPALMDAGIEPVLVRTGDASAPEIGELGQPGAVAPQPLAPPSTPPAAAPASPVTRLSYSSLGEYERCAYRFYIERVLGVPGVRPGAGGEARGAGLGGTERGILVHALLEKLDFRRPAIPAPAAIIEAGAGSISFEEAKLIGGLIGRFTASELCARLARASDVRREQRFSFLIGGDVMVTGALDVLARETGEGMLVVDYKSDRLEGRDPGAIVGGQYATQRLIYALAALRAGADSVDVAHVFLEVADRPVVARFTRSDEPELERELASLAAGVLRREFAVTETPQRSVCTGCPAEGGLCSWPLELTRRDEPDTLF
jgi:ATP-dependent exoDNAse (exonuclease V) beta subunit